MCNFLKIQTLRKGKIEMTEIKTIPQKFSFQVPNITDGHGNTKLPGISVEIEVNAFKVDAEKIRERLINVFSEVLDYFEADEEKKERRKGQKEDWKHKALLYLEDLWVDENERINEYTLEGKRGYPKEGFEKKWRQATERSDMLVKIMKLVQRETKALSIPKKREMKDIVEAILNESATAHIKGTAESAEVTIISAIERRILANLEVRISPNGCLMIDGYHFLTGSDE